MKARFRLYRETGYTRTMAALYAVFGPVMIDAIRRAA